MKLYITLLLSSLNFILNAASYQVENTTNVFSALKNANHYQQEGKIEIGFHFKVIDQYFNTIEGIDEYGRVYFFNEGDKKMNFISAAGFKNAKHIPTENESINYALVGKEGNRIFKIEWANTLYQLANGQKVAMNYQVWFYEMGFFEIHYGSNSQNMMVETPTILGLGKCALTQKGHKYSSTIEQGPFAPMLNEEFTTLRYAPGRGMVFVFNMEESYDIKTLISFKKNEEANIDLYIEMENAHTVYLSLDDDKGKTLYAEEINIPTLLIERNLDLNIDHSIKCYLNIETSEKVFITPISLK
jgi:hypothetical protein